MPAPVDPNASAAPGGPEPGVTFSTFTGLKNTVNPEMLTQRELARARNVDLDDLGQLHRRRGRRLVAPGRWRSLFDTTTGMTFGVVDGALVLVNRDFSTLFLLAGIGDDPLTWVEVAGVLYASNRTNSFKINLATLQLAPWGRVVDHSYQPGLDTGPADFWHSPVVTPDERPDSALGPVAGRLLGAPPLASHAVWWNGRIYLAAGNMLWATELFLYDLVDRNSGFRQYEHEITGLVATDDGIYVGTTAALYYVNGLWGAEVRSMKSGTGVLKGSMLNVPGELVDPEGRRFPDLPRQTNDAMACTTHDGIIIGLTGGQTYNLTRNQFLFPRAEAAAAMFREQDGMNTLVTTMKSGGTPTDSARFGDYLEATLIRAPSRR